MTEATRPWDRHSPSGPGAQLMVAETNYNNDGLKDGTINPWVFLKTLLVFTYDICSV